jgi:hypothetical protein
MKNEIKRLLIDKRKDWSNAQSELSALITSLAAGYESTRYHPVADTDRVVPGNAVSAYALRLAAAIRKLDERSHTYEELINSEQDIHLKENLMGLLDVLELQVDYLVSLYFLNLHMEYPNWRGAPLFTLRDDGNDGVCAVVMRSSITKLKSRVSKPYGRGQRRDISRFLALSPVMSKSITSE